MCINQRPMVSSLCYPKAFWSLLAGMFLNGLTTFVLPFETIYLVTTQHLPVSQASAIVAVYGVGACLSALAAGILADTIGRRPTILIGLLCLAVTTFGVAVANSIWLIVILMCSMGFWTSWYRPAVSAVIADLIPPASQGRANSLIYWIYNLGIAVSPVLASVIVERTGYLPLFCIDSVGTLLFCALLMIGLPETRPPLSIPAPHERNISASRTKGVWRDSSFLCFVVLSFVLTSVYAQNTSTLPADMQLHGLSAAQYGLAITVNGLVVVLCGLPLAHLFSRCSPWRVLAISALLIGAGFGLTSLADHLVSLPFYAGSVALWTLGEILFIPTSATIVAFLSPPSCRGTYQGVARTSWGLSACLGPLVGGFTLQLWPAYLWLSCAILGLFVAGGFLLIGRFKRLVRMSHV